MGCGKRYLVGVLSSLRWQSHDIIMTSCHPDICHDSWHKSRWCHNFSAQLPGLWLARTSLCWPLIGREMTGSVCWPRQAGRCGWGYNQGPLIRFQTSQRHSRNYFQWLARDLAHSFEIKLPLKQSVIPSELSQLWVSGLRFRCILAASAEIENREQLFHSDRISRLRLGDLRNYFDTNWIRRESGEK